MDNKRILQEVTRLSLDLKQHGNITSDILGKMKTLIEEVLDQETRISVLENQVQQLIKKYES